MEIAGIDLLDAMQWPAMAITVVAAWFVASTQLWKRNIGFWLFLVSNVAWVAWGLHSHAYALIALQACLAAMNIRGAVKASRLRSQDDENGTPAKAQRVNTGPSASAADCSRFSRSAAARR